MAEDRVVLLTGLPSFVARVLLQRLMANEPSSTFYAVVPKHLQARLRERLTTAEWERLRVFTGDTTAMDLGLSGEEYVELAEHVTDIYHMASIFFLKIDYPEAARVNVKGTKNVLITASDMNNLQRFNHFSTAFVSGKRTGVIMENDLDCGQSFRNAFEKTRFEAEVIVLGNPI